MSALIGSSDLVPVEDGDEEVRPPTVEEDEDEVEIFAWACLCGPRPPQPLSDSNNAPSSALHRSRARDENGDLTTEGLGDEAAGSCERDAGRMAGVTNRSVSHSACRNRRIPQSCRSRMLAAPMARHASEDLRESSPSLEGDYPMSELVVHLQVNIAWRPWRRARLNDGELQSVARALARANYELKERKPLPRSLSARVAVVRAGPSERAAIGGRRAWHAAVRIGGMFIGLIGLVAALITIIPELATTREPVSPPDGNLSVIVLPFGDANAAERPAAAALAHSVADTLRQELVHVDPVVLPAVHWDPLGPVASTAAEIRRAAEIAAASAADAVMFGQVASGDTARISPYVFLSARPLRQASELAGVYRLGAPITLPVELGESTAADGLARAQLAARARGLAQFLDALGYYAIGRYTQAIAHLHAAAASPSWRTSQAQAMIDLFLGNATGKLAATPTALSASGMFYRAALMRNPELERARFGLAEVEFQLAYGQCTARTVHRGRMQVALAAYRAVLASATNSHNSIASTELSAKARFGVARVYLCLSQATMASLWAPAKRELQQVIAAYRRAHWLRSEAGEAWGDLALTQLPAPGNRHSRAAYLAARASYTRALQLTLDPTGRAALYANRAFVERHLGERAAAARDESQAASVRASTACEQRAAHTGRRCVASPTA